MSALAATTVSLAASPFPPLAVGFMGLGTGYLIYGPQELFGYPKRSPSVDFGTGVWGIWLPGLMQLFAGVYLFAGLTLFGTFTQPALYAAALAFTAYGIHWFGIGWNRLGGADVRTNMGMTIGYTAISALGIVAFFGAHDNPVAGLFIGLTGIYVSDFFVSLGPDAPRFANLGLKSLGIWHLGTGLWLMYLMWATTLNFVLKWTLPL
ncbi:MAG: hypothetical protein ACRD0J_08510 [Acidimicrobiales bacterium]